jgi:hypothetical protein
MIDLDQFWADKDDVHSRGVSADQVKAWEREHCVSLPKLLRDILERRDGGFVRHAQVEIHPLAEIRPVDDDFWRFTEISGGEAADHSLVFVLGQDTEIGGQYLLNFNAQGRAGEPSIYLFFNDGCGARMVSSSLEGLLKELLTFDKAPHIDWAEAQESAHDFARETIDLSGLYAAPASLDQVLTRRGDALVFFTRLQSPADHTLTKTTLPQPLDSGMAEISKHRPHPDATFALNLQPKRTRGIIHLESNRVDEGMWKNQTSQGVPTGVSFESTTRESLEAIRTQLLGEKAASQVQAAEKRKAALEEKLQAMSPEEQRSVMLQMALKMQEEDERRAAQLESAGVPPAARECADLIKQRLDEAVERARKEVARNPPDPEAMRQIEEILKAPDQE